MSRDAQSEGVLRDEEQRWRLAIEASGDGLWDVDVAAGTSFFSRRWKEMLGYGEAEIGARREDWTNLVHPDDREEAERGVDDHIAGRVERFEAQFRMRCKDGSWRWILSRGVAVQRDAAGRALRVIGTHRDVTQVRLAREELERSERSYRDQFANNSSPMLLVDPEDGRLVEANAAACSLYGHPRERLLSLRLFDLNTAPEAEVRALLTEIAGRDGARLQVTHRLADGSERVLSASASRVQFGGRAVLHAILHDVTDRVRAEAALRESELRFRLIARNTSDGIMVFGPDHRVRYVSPAYVAQLGYSEEEELSRTPETIGALIHPEDRDATIGGVFAAIEARRPELTYSYRARRVDGRYVWREDHARFEFDEAGCYAGAWVVSRDVTDRREALAALEENREKYRALSEGTVEAIFLSEGGRCVEQNRRAEELFGYGSAEAIGRPATDWIAPEDHDLVLRNIASSSEEPYEVTARRRDGTTFPALLTPRMMRYRGRAVRVTSLRDLSRQKQIEGTLRLEGAALNAVANAVVITDRRGIIEWVNPAFCAITGYAAEEAIGRTPGQLLASGVHDNAFYRGLWETILAGRVFEGRMTNRRKDGSRFVEDATITPLLGASGEITHFIAVKQDISRQAALEAQLVQSQKLEAIGRLAGGVAHDFNNMLGVILATTECALEGTERATQLHEDLQEIRRAATRSAALTRQLLSFARQQPIEPQPLDLNEIVAGMLTLLRRLIGEDILVEWTPDDALWPVRMDPSQMDQILTNLCANARDAIADTGTIAIETNNCTIDATFCEAHADASPGDYVRLTVRDSGCGMDAATLARIFEPFFTTKAEGAGTGLGLATVYGAVRQNDGFIELQSSLGAGTTFRIHLPRHVPAGVDATAESAPRGVARGDETILVVEDEPQLLRLTVRLLRAQGYRVLEASGPEEALRVEAAHQGELHLLLTDVVMGAMNGRELATAVLARRPGTRVLYMSGYTADVTTRRGILPDGAAFLQKPFTGTELGTRVRRVLYGD